MPGVVTTCSKCGSQFQWNTDFMPEMPDCPNCGFNPNKKFTEGDVSSLIKLLKKGDREERNHAAAELGKRGNQNAVIPLIDALDDKEDIVVLPSIVALGKLKDERAVEPLINILKKNEGPSGVAAGALVKIGTSNAVKAVIENINCVDWNSTDEVFSGFALKGESLIQDIVPLLHHPRVDISEHAAALLEQWGWEPEDEQEKIAFLISAGKWGRLKEMGRPVIDYLEDILIQGEDGHERNDAAKALANIDWIPSDEEQVIAYCKNASHYDPLIKAGDDITPILVKALENENESVRSTAAEVLLEKPNPERILLLLKADIPGFLLEKALEIAPQVDDPEMIPLVTAQLKNEDYSIRCSAATALGEIKGEAVFQPLINALNDQEEFVQKQVINALGKLGNKKSVGELVRFLKGGSLKEYAAEALGEIGDARAIEPLMKLVDNKRVDNYVRESAAVAVEKITGKRPKVKGGGDCFIATAAMGDYDHPTVLTLRDFRDTFLQRSKPGQWFIKKYYKYSPFWASIIENSRILRCLCSWTLISPLACVWHFIKHRNMK